MKKKVIKHLKEDMETYKHESKEDEKLMKSMKKEVKHKKPKESHKKPKESPKAKKKIEKVMHEYKEGELHEGSKKGPVVTGRKQAIAIALNVARKKGLKVPKKKKKK